MNAETTWVTPVQMPPGSHHVSESGHHPGAGGVVGGHHHQRLGAAGPRAGADGGDREGGGSRHVCLLVRPVPRGYRRWAECTVEPVTDTTACESCGRDEPAAEVLAVHRVYVTPAAWDVEERIEVLDGTERWCPSCRSTYPHKLEGADELEL